MQYSAVMVIGPQLDPHDAERDANISDSWSSELVCFCFSWFLRLIFWLFFHFAERDSGEIIPAAGKCTPPRLSASWGVNWGPVHSATPVHVYRIYIYKGISW